MARFIKNFATVSAPFWHLKRKNVPWQWTDVEENAFNMIKDALASTETLAYFDTSADDQLVVDASPVGLVANFKCETGRRFVETSAIHQPFSVRC